MRYTDAFKALSDTTRLRVLYVLLKARKELCICELMDSLEVRHYNVSRCLKELRIAGLVKEKKEGRFVFYKVNDIADKFQGMIYKLISALPEKEFEKDLARVYKRISLRQNGKVVVTMRRK
jgi:ArsR family transcriptional regulator